MCTAAAVRTGDDVVSFEAKGRKLFVNHAPRALDFDVLRLKGGAAIKRETDGNHQILTIRSKNNDFVRVRLDGGWYFDFGVSLNPNRQGRVQGLFGNYDGQKGNDLQLRNGERVDKSFAGLYPKYADNWRIEPVHSLFTYEPGAGTQTYTRKNFPVAPLVIPADKLAWAEGICKQAGINGEPFRTHCICDVAVTGDPAVAKSAAWEQQQKIGNALPPINFSNIQLQGDAQVMGNFIRLTPAKLFKAGQAFLTTPLTGDFETEFTYKIPYAKLGSGDGFAFVIAKDIPQQQGNPYPGHSGKLGYQGVKASLAVEFDTWPEAASAESGNHLAIHTNGREANSTGHTTRLAYNDNVIPLADGMFHSVRIRYKNKQLTVFLDDAQVLQTAVDLAEKLGPEGGFYTGFTSSTSGSYGEHNICSWTTKAL